nr:hypothetical protein L203_04814 [Cryptococcus depauperatus CBS 7841]
MRVYNGDDDIRMTDIATVTGIQECLRKVSNNPFDQGCGRQLELGETNVAEIVRPVSGFMSLASGRFPWGQAGAGDKESLTLS